MAESLRFRRTGTYTNEMLLKDLQELDDLVSAIQNGINDGSLKGDKGDKGDKGIAGTPGAKGNKGDQGIQGIQGLPGIDGTDGIDGLDGDSNFYDRGNINTDCGLITSSAKFLVDYGFIS